MSYTLNETLLGLPFATAHYEAFVSLKRSVDNLIAGAAEIRITCPSGTEIVGRPRLGGVPGRDTALRRFPMTVFSPVPADAFSGRAALCGFLTGTGSRYYEGYTRHFDGPVFARLVSGRVTGFEGAAADVARADAQYDRVAGLYGIDRNKVHSWHAGIHPGCGFPWDAATHAETWGGAAFGNPRILHFHTCGEYAPGEISWNVIDPTIEIDGVAYWQKGRFRADLLPGGTDILDRYPCAAAAFSAPDRRIGFGEEA